VAQVAEEPACDERVGPTPTLGDRLVQVADGGGEQSGVHEHHLHRERAVGEGAGGEAARRSHHQRRCHAIVKKAAAENKGRALQPATALTRSVLDLLAELAKPPREQHSINQRTSDKCAFRAGGHTSRKRFTAISR
jgi:hypothetical protein